MSKLCPLLIMAGSFEGKYRCLEAECAFYVPDWEYPKDEDPVDMGWCAIRELASKLGYLRSLDNEY